jgi:hypothetical protein
MATVKHAIEENDVVALRERVSGWPAGTVGTAVCLSENGALVEISENEPPGEALAMIDVPFEQLELRWSSRFGWVDGMEA